MVDQHKDGWAHRLARLQRRLRVIAAEELRALAFVAVVALIFIAFRQFVFGSLGPTMVSLADYVGNVRADFMSHLGSVLLMMLVIQPVRRLGPPGGWRRAGAVAGAVVLAAALAAACRALLMLWADGMEPGEFWSGWHVIFVRFAILAPMPVIVAEFHRHEIRCLEAMRAAEADREALERTALQARLKTLEAQIEPHFLFNTLANVRRLYETDAAAGEAMLERLVRYLEIALPSMRGTSPTLDSEAQLIEAYLELQRVRMGRRLNFSIDIPAPLRALEVPPMMLLTLVENAIKHGLAPLREGGHIVIDARLDNAQLRLAVADTGRGFGGDTAGGGTGLANIRARLAAMFGSAAELTLTPRMPSGLLASIRMPVGAT